MKKVLMLFFCFLVVILESTLLVRFRIAGIIPNLSLVIVMSIGLSDGCGWGRGAGFFTGLTHDVLFSHRIGYFALIYYLLGHVSGYGHRILRRANLLIPLILILIGDILFGLINFFFLKFLHGVTDFPMYFHEIILTEASYTSFFVLPLYCLITWSSRKLSHFRMKDMITHRFSNEETLMESGSHGERT